MRTTSPLLLSLALVGSFLCLCVLTGVLQAEWPEGRWHQMPLHSTMEALGGLASIAMAAMLLQKHDERMGRRWRAPAAGFLGMGILELFHATAQPGDGFVLLRNMASLIGSAGFVMLCRRRPDHDEPGRAWLPWGITAGATLFGVLTIAYPDRIPEMIRNGEFTPTAVAPQSLACLFFLAASARLLWDYRQSADREDLVLASLAGLFGVAELVFMYSIPWDGRWWFWHGLRLAAYLLVLGEVGRGYLRTISDLNRSLEQTTVVQRALRESEHDLRRSLEDRERIAQNLHDGIIQSLFAVTLSLERCQRFVTDRAGDVVGLLGSAIADLTLVIRDLRGYLVGLEQPILNGRELEAAFDSLVRSMAGPAHPLFRLAIDPAAADLVTPEQAAHLLAVAREAMSNSLRHSGARTGTVSLCMDAGHVRLIVEDDGAGCRTSASHDQGHGLKNMAARARALKGRFDILSEPNRGTRIIFDLPDREASHASA